MLFQQKTRLQRVKKEMIVLLVQYIKKTGTYAVVVGQYLLSSENMGAKFMPRRTLHCIH